MVSINKDFFIVLDRNPLHTKKEIFTVYLFYLKKKTGRQLIYSSQPFFKGELTFGLDLKNKIRPVKFEKHLKGGTKPVDPRLFKEFLKSNKNKFLAISDQANIKNLKSLMQMLKSFQFNRIERLTLCNSCLNNNKFTLLDKSEIIRSFKYHLICPNCALSLVINELKMRDIDIKPKLKDFLKHLILKFKNVKKILTTFTPNFNPVKNSDLTLYDLLEKRKEEGREYKLTINEIDFPDEFKELLKKEGYGELLPIQIKSIESGLLDVNKNIDLMIVSQTSSGKTLIAELAGIKKILMNKENRMLYLVPIVALANLRYEEFKERYNKLGINVAIRVGKTIIGEDYLYDSGDIRNSQIIVGTYEALDFFLRSGNPLKLGEFKTIIIDEIQNLGDSERGFIIDGLISRLKSLFLPNKSQYLYLSATVGKPEDIATELNAKLIRYSERPVPVERHLLLCLNEHEKNKNMSKLIKHEFSKVSNYGFKGQTIVFTNSRKNCHTLSEYLRSQRIKVEAYHAGLTYKEKKEIEDLFLKQKISAVVTTAALAAGVDFPASQVIFDSLAMGINWLKVSEFEQMYGRAGRFKKHDLGKIYLLVIPNRIFNLRNKETEEKVALHLLNGKLEPIEVEPDEDRMLTELLSFITMKKFVKYEDIREFQENLINSDYLLDDFLKVLIQKKLINKEASLYKTTKLGTAISTSFLTINEALLIKDQIFIEKIPLETVALNLEPLKNVYVSNKIVSEVSKSLNAKYVSNQLFSGTILSIMESRNYKKRKSFPKFLIDILTNWIKILFNCECKDAPYCDCGLNNLQNLILSLRIDKKYSIDDIYYYLLKEFEIIIYRGDLIDFFESLIHSFQTIKNICESLKLNEDIKEKLLFIPKMIEKIKDPKISNN